MYLLKFIKNIKEEEFTSHEKSKTFEMKLIRHENLTRGLVLIFSVILQLYSIIKELYILDNREILFCQNLKLR